MENVHQSSDSLLSRKEVGQLLGLCVESVKRREKAGLIPAIKLSSKTVRYRRSDIEKLILRSEYQKGQQ